VGEQVFAVVSAEGFYILTHPVLKDLVRERMEGILEERNPAAI